MFFTGEDFRLTLFVYLEEVRLCDLHSDIPKASVIWCLHQEVAYEMLHHHFILFSLFYCFFIGDLLST